MHSKKFETLKTISQLYSDKTNQIYPLPLNEIALPKTLNRYEDKIYNFAIKEYSRYADIYFGCLEDVDLYIWKWEDRFDSDFVIIPTFQSKFAMISSYWIKYYPFIKSSNAELNWHFTTSIENSRRHKITGEYIYFGGHQTFGHWIADFACHALTLNSFLRGKTKGFLTINLENWQAGILTSLTPEVCINNLDLRKLPSGLHLFNVDKLWLIDNIDIANRYKLMRMEVTRNFLRTNSNPEFLGRDVIFLQRSSFGSKKVDRILNRQEIEELLRSRNVKFVDPVKLDFSSRLKAMYSASVIINEPGSGEFNYHLFARPGAKLIQLVPSAFLASPNHQALQASWKYMLPSLDSTTFVCGLPPLNNSVQNGYTDQCHYDSKILGQTLNNVCGSDFN